jgi:gentisate 1,2-dioxygenase
MTDDMTIQIDSEQYVLRPEGNELKVGRRNGEDVAWLDTVDLALLPGPAREALERGDTSDEALLTALRGVGQAEVERGG